MTKLLAFGLATVCAIILSFNPGAAKAPIPKDAGKGDGIPDIKEFLSKVGKAVENEKGLSESDERLLREGVSKIFNQSLAAAEQKERKLPVVFENLRNLNVTRKYSVTGLKDSYLIGEDVLVTGVQNSVIFASGFVHVKAATNSVIVAKNIRGTSLKDCVVIAAESIQATDIRSGDIPASVLVAGMRIRATLIQDSFCHVIRPGEKPPPNQDMSPPADKAITANTSTNAYFLNAEDDTRTRIVNCKFLPLKKPIAK